MSTTSPATPLAVLQRYFGYDAFRLGQEEIINSVLGGGDTLVVMPTGGGKSLCYQVPSLLLSGVTIVVSPLIALMKDQVDALHARDIGATTINSTLDFREARQRLTDLRQGKYRLLYVAPERFESPKFLEMMKGIDVSLFAVDEAHCVSEWGHDFRPSYLRLKEAIESVGRPPVVALTATATPYVQEDIITQLGLQKLKRFVKGFDRPNLAWEVEEPADKTAALRASITDDLTRDGVVIVYSGTRKRVEEIGTALHADGMPVTIYHAGLPDNDRRRAQEAFITGKARVIVATNAFGMGIDKPDVRAVYHVDMPGSIESYYQEGGRAGRDGLPSRCVLYWAHRDRTLQEFFIRNSFPERETLENVYNALWDSVQVAVGSRYEGIFVVNEKRLLGRARIHPASLNGAISVLSKSRIIEQIRSDRLAMVRFLVGGDEVKRFYNVTQDQVRKKTVMALLRTIGGGALSREVMFNPDTLARNAELTPEEFDRGMRALTMSRMLVYTPPAARGGIRFLQERLPSRNIRIDEPVIERERTRAVRRLDAIERYARTTGCRRDFILEYFGADPEPQPCGRCDNCRRGTGAKQTIGVANERSGAAADTTRRSEIPEAHLTAFLTAVAALGGRFGKMTVVDFLLGEANRTITSFGLTEHPRFGALKGESRGDLTRTADQLMRDGLLRSTAGMKPVVQLTRTGEEMISSIQVETFSTTPPVAERTTHPDLYEKLVAERDAIADRDGFTRVEVCPDNVLLKISDRVPTNKSELMRTTGYTMRHFDLCGTSFLQIIEGYRDDLEGDTGGLALPIRLRPTYELYRQGYDLNEIARDTARQPSTVSGHVEELIKLGAIDDIGRFVTEGIIKSVREVIEARPYATLRELRALTGGGIDFPELRIAAQWVRSAETAEENAGETAGESAAKGVDGT